MTDFDGRIGLVQDNDNLQLVCVLRPNKKKLQVLNEKGREQSLNENKILWFYPSSVANLSDWNDKLTQVQQQQQALLDDVDIELLWESAQELEAESIDDLADLYFDAQGTPEKMAIWQALAADGLHFKRKGNQWQSRPQDQIEALRTQRQREHERAELERIALGWLELAIKAKDSCAISEEAAPFVERVNCWLRGDQDKNVEKLLQTVADKSKLELRELAFEVLLKAGKLPADADRDIVIAGLQSDFSQPIYEAANAVTAWEHTDDSTPLALDFSIDDPDTQEVDDALAIHAEGDLWHIDIAIADPGSFIEVGDTLDREAMRRSTTVYLPTQTVLMLPPVISCDIASLSAEKPRPSVVIQVVLDNDAQVQNMSIQRHIVTVQQRLDYDGADAMLNDASADSDTAKKLKQMQLLCEKLKQQRMDEGALMIQRSEFKIKVNKAEEVSVKMLDSDSPSRALVAELMILANHQAGRFAQKEGIPLIFRTQAPPAEPISREVQSDPLVFQKIGKLLKPSSLSLEPGGHSGLGLSVYTQVSSPLRRFADLVMQRQLIAHIKGEELPYNQEELFKVLATAEQNAKQARYLENTATRRWFIRYLEQQHKDSVLDGLVMAVQKVGYKVNLLPWGVDAWLNTNDKLEPGTQISVKIEKLRIKAGQIRLLQV